MDETTRHIRRRGRGTSWALLAALITPLGVLGILLPSRRAPAAVEHSVGDARTAAVEPPTDLVAPPAAAPRRRAAPAPRPNRTKASAFDAAVERTLAAQAAALASAAPRSGTLTLHVVDAETRRPVPHTVVELQHGGAQVRHRADAAGKLELVVGSGYATVVAWSDTRSAGPLSIEVRAGEATRAALALVPSAPVAGTIVDARTGAPIQGATVAFWTHSELDRERTDAAGRFRHPRFPAHTGEQQVRIEAPGYAPAVRYLELDPDGAWRHRAAHAGEQDVAGVGLPLTVDVALLPEATIQGRAIDAFGQPIQGAQVECVGYARVLPDVATRDAGEARTDKDGFFRVSGLRPDVSHALCIRAAGHARLMRELPASGDAHDGVLDLGEVVLDRPGVIAGVLVDAAGEPIVGAHIRVRRSDAPAARSASPADPAARPALGSQTARSDENGSFAFEDLAPGQYELRARRDRDALVEQTIELYRGEERAGLLLSPTAPTFTLRGSLATPNGPLAHAKVRLARFGTVCEVLTDARGEFAVAGLDDAATYTVCVAEAGFAPTEEIAWAFEPVRLATVPADTPAVLARR